MKIHKIILLLLLSANIAVANPQLTHYRNTGEILLEKELDKQLAQKEYWIEFLKNVDTSLGFIENSDSILICNKSEAKLSLYKKDNEQKFIKVKEYHAYTGKKQGDKVKEGDLKTPHGIYEITKKITKLDSFYGPMAFVTSYPNIYDTYRGKSGSGIWIHGLPIEQERDEFTKGCIAINNSNLVCLNDSINFNSTLLVISPKEVKRPVSKNLYAQILSNLFQWRYSWLYNDIESYLSFYSQDFVRHDNMGIKSFVKYKTRIFQKNEKKTIIFKNINVIPYPDTKDIFKITFKELYSTDTYSFEGDKILIVQVDQSDKFKIITEK